MNISLFITCFNDTLYPETGKAVVSILERLGHTVHFPLEQTCCGQMHYNTGYHEEINPLVERFADQFESAEAVVSPSASCVGMIHEFYPKLAALSGSKVLQDRIDALIPKVHEFTMFLVNELKVEDVGAYYPHRVTYHSTCHSLRSLKIGDAPLRLLRNVKGIDLVDLPGALECCGFGGTFALKNADTSAAMLGDKIRHIKNTGAEVCTSADNSCLMHIGGALNRQRSGVKTVHMAEILNTTEEGAQV